MKSIDISGLAGFPDEPRRDEPKGKEFVMLSDVYADYRCGLRAGDIVTLRKNDISRSPFFTTSDGWDVCISWAQLADIPKEEEQS